MRHIFKYLLSITSFMGIGSAGDANTANQPEAEAEVETAIDPETIKKSLILKKQRLENALPNIEKQINDAPTKSQHWWISQKFLTLKEIEEIDQELNKIEQSQYPIL